MKPVWIGREEIDDAFTMKDAIFCAKEALAAYSAGKYTVPLRTALETGGRGQVLVMPGYNRASGVLGVKIVSVFPGNVAKNLPVTPATMLLLDEETGVVRAVMDGTHITRLRTGAVGGLAIDLLARKDAAVFALFGTGGQAQTQLEACLSVRKIAQVLVYDIDAQRADTFAQHMQVRFAHLPVTIYAAASPGEAVANADIITAVTTARMPVFDGRLVKRGCHVNSIGSFTPEMCEVDDALVCGADKRFVDTREAVLTESGCILQPIAAGKLREEDITGEIGEVVLGTKPGRQRDDEITYFDSVGTAALDVAAAGQIYKSDCERRKGTKP